MAAAPLNEIGPNGPGTASATLGFTLALASQWAGPAGLVWAGEEAAFAEEGAPYPPGLAQYGLDPRRLIVIRARKRDDALWAAEQGLAAPGAVVICALGARGKPLELKASRRLLLFAERNRSRCLLLKPADGVTAAWTRWRVSPASSCAPAHEISTPAFSVELTRNRAGPVGATFTLDWNADARAFTERGLARDLSAASQHGSADQIRARA